MIKEQKSEYKGRNCYWAECSLVEAGPCVEGHIWICSGMAMPSSCSLANTRRTWGPEREGRSQNHLRPLTRFMSQRYSCYLLLCVRAITKKNEASALYCKGAVIGEACDLKFVMGCTGKAECGECKTAWLTYVPGAKYVGCNLLRILTVYVLWDNLMHLKIPPECYKLCRIL